MSNKVEATYHGAGRAALAAHLYRTAATATGEPQRAWELIDQDVWLRAADEAVAAMGGGPWLRI